jgi:hypothetical protein
MSVLLFLNFALNAQSISPMYEAKFYFEDAIGNRDTLIMGYDTTANDEFNPQFGELNLTDGFDSVFEVRATQLSGFNWGQSPYILSKKVYSLGEDYINLMECFGGGGAICFINAKYQPITISWDITYMDNLCNRASFFTPDHAWELVHPLSWFENPIRYGCASTQGSYTLFLGKEHYDWFEIPYVIEYPIIGSQNPLDSIYGVCFSGFWADWWFSPCSLSDSKEPYQEADNLKINPNPVYSSFTLSVTGEKNDEVDVQIISSSGIPLKNYRKHQSNQPIDVSDLPNGLYFLVSRSKDELIKRSQFVKFSGD